VRTVTTASPSVVDLRERPEFAPLIADRVWRAWWKSKGHALAFIEGLVQQNLNAEPIPLAVVAHDGETFLGTASVIRSDLDVRPQYTPWVAAVWVDPMHRSKGVSAALVQVGAEKARALGFDPVYLCALPPKHGFYQWLGWRLVEAGVTEAGLAVFRSP
jgi:predicted N-acetyltransferase YhbS